MNRDIATVINSHQQYSFKREVKFEKYKKENAKKKLATINLRK